MNKELIHAVIEYRTILSGDCIAISEPGGEISYHDLNAGANRVAHLLMEQGVSSSAVIAVLLPPGIRLAESMLGIFKCGAVYMPLDESFSGARLRQMFEQTGCMTVIAAAGALFWLQTLLEQQDIHPRNIIVLPPVASSALQELDLPGISISEEPTHLLQLREDGSYDEQSLLISAFPDSNPDISIAGTDPNYIFYTSGSTGKGKGITGSHRSLSHYIRWHAAEWKTGEGTRISQIAPVTFDASLKDILVALASGATLCVPGKTVRENIDLLCAWLAEERINLVQTVPSVFRLLTRSIASQGVLLPDLKNVVLAGERLYGRDVMNWRTAAGNEVRLSNLYGLTETTILKSCYHIDNRDYAAGEVMPVGRPIANTAILVINDNMLCDEEEIGDVYISSDYVSRGYVDTALNDGLFVQNPLVADRLELVCRTGDIGRYRADGNLEILGRRDEQLKINGVRLEPGEIRAALLSLDGIDQVELVVHEDDQYNQELICYYQGASRSADQLRQQLGNLLNRQLLPSYFVWLEEFPLNINGKVDRKALPRPDEMLQSGKYEAPSGRIEEGMAAIWKQVLGVNIRIGREDSFFSMGGSSLKAIQLISRIYKEYEVRVTIADIFDHPLLKDQALLITGGQNEIFRPIAAVPDQPHYALSYEQRRLWVLDRLNDTMTAYSRPIAFRLQGTLNREALERAFTTLIERNEILRTVFREAEGEPRQFVLSTAASGFSLRYEDLRTEARIGEALAIRTKELAGLSYQLGQGPMLRVWVLQTGEELFELLLSIHHIISDEWSMQVLIKELTTLYNSYAKGDNIPLQPLRIQYRDYAAWQQEVLQGEGASVHKDYWLKQLDGLSVLELPADSIRPAVQTFNGRQLQTIFGYDESYALRSVCERHDATLFMGLTALVTTLLYRYTGQEDITIGTPVAGRNHPDTEGQIGFYVNTLALRTYPGGKKGFNTFLEEIKSITLGALAHQLYPFDRLVDELNLSRDMSRSPVFDVAVVLQNVQVHAGEQAVMEGLEISQSGVEVTTSLYDLTFWFTEQPDGIVLKLEYNTDLFREDRINRMLQHLNGLLSAIIADPARPLQKLDYLAPEQKERILYGFNNTVAAYPTDKTLVDLFEWQAAERNFISALKYGDHTLSYAVINMHANRLAHFLREECNAGPGQLIGLLMDRSEWLVIGLLGILKSGAAYVPVDPAYPRERIQYILEDSGTGVLVTDQPGWEDSFTCINPADAKLSGYPEKNPRRINDSRNLAYVIYTSGSTGKPKGVMIEHRSVINFLYSVIHELRVTPSDCWLAVTTYSFDISVLEIFAPLVSGASLVLAGSDVTANPPALLSLLEKEKPSIMQATPGFWSLLTDAGWAGDQSMKLLTGGEALPFALGKKLRRLCGTLYNMYGPTETTIWSTFKKIHTDEDCLVIGVPLANTKLYVLDDELQPVPEGIPGQLYIGGDGLARGYYRQPGLTAEKFISNPFKPGELMYNSGDRCWWTEQGEIKYLGRADFMIKLRGYRVELGEIEQVLLEDNHLQDAVAALKEKNGERYIAAYFTATVNKDTEELGARLRRRLPEYMVPSYFIQLERLPVNANGKVDRKALPEPEAIASHEYIAPRNATESLLARIWEEVLGRERVGINDHFFHSGGHSLRAIQVLSRIYKTCKVQLELRDIFLYPLLADMAAAIGRALPDSYRPIDKIPDQAYYPLSHSQRRLWLLNKIEGISNTYVIPVSYRLSGALDGNALQQAFHTLIGRHEILRTYFGEVNGEPVQFVKETNELAFSIGFTDCRSEENAVQKAQDEGMKLAMQPFLLDAAPLMRAHLWQTGDEQWLFFFGIHHIITDEWSMQVLIRELLDIYNAYRSGQPDPCPPLKLQYRDYAAWQVSEMMEQQQTGHRSFWMEKLGDELPVLELPTDFQRPRFKTYNGGLVKYQLPAASVSSLLDLCEKNGASAFMGFTALVNTLLYRYSGHTDIIIGTPVAGRDHPDLEDQLGFFVNNLAIRNTIDPGRGFIQLLETVKQNLLQAFEHQSYPFDQLVEYLAVVRDTSRSPLFDVVLNWQNAIQDQVKGRSAEGLTVEDNMIESHVTKTDLTFLLKEPLSANDNMFIAIEYNTDLFSAERIERMASHLEGLLAAIAAAPGKPLATLNFMSAAECELIKGFSHNPFEFPDGETLVSLFEKQVNAQPGAIALVCGDTRLSFAELNSRVNLMAHHLRENSGLMPGRIAGILLERSEWMIVSILAVLKTGAAYLPIDPSAPADRVQYLVSDSHPDLLITESHQLFNLPDTGVSFFIIDIEFDALSGRDDNPGWQLQPHDLAYIIYTSGSTGNPKGVMIEHRSCVNMLWNEREIFAITPADRILQFASISVDASVAEIFVALLSGVTLVVTPPALVKDGVNLVKYMKAQGVTMVIWPTAFLNSLDLDEISFLQKIITAGDVANPADAIRCSRSINYFNCYGPTEGTVWSTVFKVDAQRHASLTRLPIGRPIGNIDIYIVNEALELQPPGIPGELCIGGLSLARGYLGRENLTAEKFVQNPFGDGRLYRTGDLAAWLPDGNIDFIGRLDNQVKIRGYRVEIGEVEQVLLSNGKVQQAVVKALGEQSEKYLVAYYTSDTQTVEEELRQFLSKRLPDYMIPSWFVRMDQMPINASGKIHRRALPEPQSVKTYTAPRSVAEQQLADVWSAILNLKQISAEDNFFNIGGQSLKAIQVVNELSKRYGVQLKIPELFETPRLCDLALRIEHAGRYSPDPILPAASQQDYPLSHGQHRLWILEQFEGMSAVYVLSSGFWLRGHIEVGALERSFHSVIARHESLRTVFHTINGEPRQVILPAGKNFFSIDFYDYRSAAGDPEALAIAEMEKKAFQPFDLKKGPLFRVLLSRVADETFLLTLSIHHIISDEWSLQVMVHEVLHTYHSLVTGKAGQLQPLSIQYKDYVAWQQAGLAGDQLKSHRDYWLEKLGGELPQLRLPADRPRPPAQTYNGAQYRYNLSASLSQGFHSYCTAEGATLFMGLVALVNTILYRYTGQDDIIVGSPVAGRDHPDLAGQIGYFVNTLPLRTTIKGEESFRELLVQVKDTVLQAFHHQVYPFDKLVDELDLVRDISRAPVFDVVVVLQNADQLSGLDARLEGVEVEEYLAETANSKIDLRLFFTENENSITVTVDYNTDLFNRDRMARLAQHIETLMHSVLEEAETNVKELAFIPEREKEIILQQFNPAPADFDLDKTVTRMLEEQAAAAPGSPALVSGEQQWTYDELNRQANRLAHHLRYALNIQPDELVGVMTDRNEWMIIAVLGVLKAGAAYLPIDPALPAERIQFMLDDSKARLLISESAFLYDKPEFDGEALWLDIEMDMFEVRFANPEPVNHPGHLAYVIYTSGSTGTPKGVMIEHRSCSNLVYNQKHTFGISPADRVLQFSSISFDGSFFEFVMALCHGASLVLTPAAIARDGLKLLDYMEASGVSIAILPSAFIDTLELDRLRFLRVLLTVGDVANTANAVYCSAFTKLYNGYGPTECTVWALAYRVDPADQKLPAIPVGKPVLNSAVYILDASQELLPIGVPGELCIAGAGLARGYLNRADLTAEKFIQNPFDKGRLYKTGDMVRWLADGNIEFIGRIDNQVKIRGYRIEIGEVERAITSYDDIELAAVVAYGTDNEKYLAAYYTDTAELSPEELKNRLSKKLPEYMVPAFLVRMENMPVNNSGKVDRKKLPVPGRVEAKEYLAPATDTERELAFIWQQVLDLELVGREDNFFAIGGNSLKAVQLISQVYRSLDVQVPIGEVFNQPVLSALALVIDTTRQSAFTPVTRMQEAADYPLSYAQRRLWLQEHYRGDAVPYNAADAFVLSGWLNADAFEQALSALVDRHESLRTVFVMVDAEVRQRIIPFEAFGFTMDYRDLCNEPQPLEAAKQLLDQLAVQPFNLEQPPLFRAGLFRTGDAEYIFAFCLHHIISDEWSMQVLFRELITLYNAYNKGIANPLPPLAVQYRDFAAWEAKELSGERLLLHRNYWMKKLESPLPVLQLPTDRPRPQVQTFHGSHLSFTLSKEQADGLKALCLRHRATLFMGLTAVIKALLYQYTGQHDIIIGTPVAGRNHPDLDGQIGYYLNTIAIRTQLEAEKGFGSLLDEIKKNAMEAFSHQAYPFDRLVEDLDLEPDPSRPPLFDVSLILQNIRLYNDNVEMDGIEATPLGVELPISKGDLRFQFTEQPEHIDGDIEFNTDLFDRDRILRMTEHLHHLLDAIIRDEQLPLHTLDYSDGSGRQLMENFVVKQPEIPFISVSRLFEAAVASYTNHTAAEEDGLTITYRQLNENANRLAAIFSGIVKSENVVAVLLPSGIRLVETALGVFKSGLVYMSLDRSFSSARIRQMFEETEAGCLVTMMENQDWVSEQIAKKLIAPHVILYLPSVGTGYLLQNRQVNGTYSSKTIDFAEWPVHNPDKEPLADAPAYIYYTSGSTGGGKGIVGSHRGLSHYAHWHADRFKMGPGTRVSQIAAVGFDAWLKDVFPALISGAAVCIPGREIKENMGLLGQWLRDSKVTIVQTVPSVLRMLVRSVADHGGELPEVEELVLAGERLYGRDIESWRRINKASRISNLYGLTETTILKSCFHVEEDHEYSAGEVLPVGKAIGNTVIAVISDGRLCSQGEIGEVYIKSPYITKGYIRTELNKDFFVQNPLVNKSDREDIVFRTGDTGRYREDGNLEILGRRDEQVKIGGVRVELGEVKAAVLSLSGIEQVELVVHTTEESNTELLCYYTGVERSTEHLRESLSGILNRALLPSYYVWLAEFPLTINGKVDRKGLPRPWELLEEAGYEAADGGIEEGLVNIWQQVLGINSRIGRTDSFFAMGGSSLKAIQLISRIYKEYDVQLTIGEVFSHGLLKEQAELISKSGYVAYAGIPKATEQDYYELSYAQRRLWVLEEQSEGGPTYNIPMWYKVKGYIDIPLLENCFTRLIERHESLRTVFTVVMGEPVQRILSAAETGFALQYTDMRKEKDASIKAFREADRFCAASFDLQQPPLVRVKLMQTADDTWVLAFVVHHIIGDEWSMQVLAAELLELYNAGLENKEAALPSLPVQYRDYVSWQQKELSGKNFEKHRAYWLKKLEGDIPVMEIPCDRPRPARQTFEGDQLQLEIPDALFRSLQQLCGQQEATLFMGLTAALHTLLYHYSGQHDQVIGTPVAGRDHPDLENQIGYYINTLALRTKLEVEKDFITLLNNVKQTTLEGFEHRIYPFDLLVEDLDIPADLSRAPLFDVAIILQNIRLQKYAQAAMQGADLEPVRPDVKISKGDIRFQFTQEGETMAMDIEFNTAIFDRARIEKMGAHFLRLLSSILQSPGIPLTALEYLSEGEKQLEQMESDIFGSAIDADF